MSEIAIAVDHVSKMYKLYDKPMDRLKESLGLSRQKKYKEHFALDDVSFQVHQGETVRVSLEQNGSRKVHNSEDYHRCTARSHGRR
ncbi:MAG: hypothetical protein ACLUL2_14070 [Blautia sp.]